MPRIAPLFEGGPRGVEGEGRQTVFVGREEGDLVHVVVGFRLASQQLGAIDDDDVGPTRVLPPGDYVEQAGDPDLQPRLLPTFAHCSLSRVLVEIDESGRKGPQPLTGLHTPADEKHLALIVCDEHASGDLVLAEDDQVTDRTETAHAPESLPVF